MRIVPATGLPQLPITNLCFARSECGMIPCRRPPHSVVGPQRANALHQTAVKTAMQCIGHDAQIQNYSMYFCCNPIILTSGVAAVGREFGLSYTRIPDVPQHMRRCIQLS